VSLDELLAAECRVCGCSHYNPCEGGCVWAEPDLCSRCAQELPTDPTGELVPATDEDWERWAAGELE
jgi:hypothetical protein